MGGWKFAGSHELNRCANSLLEQPEMFALGVAAATLTRACSLRHAFIAVPAIMGAGIAASAQILEQTLRRAPLPLGKRRLPLQNLLKDRTTIAEFLRGLYGTFVPVLGLLPAYDLTNRRARSP